MGERLRTASNLELVGGRLCLDFANTVSTRIEKLSRDYLNAYGDLVAWGRHAGVLTDDEAQALHREAARRPHVGATALKGAILLRETIYRVFSAISENQEPAETDLVALNTWVHRTLSRLELVPSESGYDWSWVVEEDDLDRVLYPVVRSAADLLISGDLGKISRCARDGCDWLFVDLSKNHSRRWCSMQQCGSRVKARRYYRRRKG
jgi:predicted RNA-binding Zn ribbon-like protein